ncbi:MAG: ATP-binding protein [Candidatus Omnitrophota bacterium]
MENLLPERTHHLILAVLVMLAAAAVFFFALLYPYHPDNGDIYQSITTNIHSVESALKNQIHLYQTRAKSVSHRFHRHALRDSDLISGESLIIEKNGVIADYYGEIYHFKFKDGARGQWFFSLKNNALYFSWKLSDHLYYFRYFGALDHNRFLGEMNDLLPFTELKYSKDPISPQENGNKYQFESDKKRFIHIHLLNDSNGQLILSLKFFKSDIDQFYKKKRMIFLSISIAVLLILLILIVSRRRQTRWGRMLIRLLALAFLVDLFALFPLLVRNNLYLTLHAPIGSGQVSVYSTYQVIVILLMILSVFYVIARRVRREWLAFLLFNGSLFGVMNLFDRLLQAADFNYTEFGPDYLSFIAVIFLLHLIPLVFIRSIAHKRIYGFSEKRRRQRMVLYLIAQSLIILLLASLFRFHTHNGMILSVVAFILLFFRRGLLNRAVMVFLLAVSSYILIAGGSLQEKKAYISDNLKDIFLNQSNYAKFIAREIVKQINLSGRDFYTYFEGDASAPLEAIWRKTIASRENIASGIFVVSKDNRILNFFAYQIPFLEAKIGTIFPFWAMEDTTAEIHGKEIPLAAAVIGINKTESPEDYKSEYLGYIIVEVLDSPELLLRYQDRINIFTIDTKVDGKDFSYIKLNSENQIIENPSNINLENIAGILQNQNRWIEFKYMDLTFNGYIFKHGGNSIIIFFPTSTLVKDFSGIIKIFLFFSLFFLAFYIKNLRKVDWRSIYYSFSIRVFFFLIMISLLTAVVFSVFFFNFSSKSMEQKVQRIVYENGRIAQNIAYNLIKAPNGLYKNELFAISEILSSDVNVYAGNGLLLEPSNYRKLLNSQIPDYLHSRILTLLNKKNQRFVLDKEKGNFNMYFKVYDYIFMVQFSTSWERALSEDPYYLDFFITLFFIMFVIGFFAAFFFRNRILSPIAGLSRGMLDVEKGNLNTLDQIPSELEIKNLYQGFNSMIEGIREQKRSISEISRMKTIIRLGRRVAHEVKNPLTPIKLSAEQILKALTDKNPRCEDIIRQSVNYIIDETEHLKKVSYGFLDLSRLDEISVEEFDLIKLIHDEIFNVRQLYAHIEFSVDIRERNEAVELKDFRVTLDKIKIKQVLKNLINNSIEAIEDKTGEVRITVQRDGSRVIIEVADNGVGMDEWEVQRLLEADYSTKEIGSGLGLFIVRRIIELHKGHMEILSEKNKGTRVIIDLPDHASSTN